MGTREDEDQRLRDQLEDEKRRFDKYKQRMLKENHLDEDGYPTDAALKLISKWHWTDCHGWFDFIKSIWWSPDWGWAEKQEQHDWKEGVTVTRYHVSTGGWSGNEDIIRAMQKNEMMWFFNWVQSRRGGHYIFEPKEIT